MIRTTYVRPEGAAAILDIEVDELLIAAAEGRVRLYGLVHVLAQSELGRYEVDEGSEMDESGQSRWLCVKSEFPPVHVCSGLAIGCDQYHRGWKCFHHGSIV